MIFDINILAKEEWWLDLRVVGWCVPGGGCWPSCAYSLSSVSVTVPLCCSQFSLRLNWWKRALLCEKGERTVNECTLEKSQLFTARSKELAKQKAPPGLFSAEDTSETHTVFFRKTLFSSQRKFWDTVTTISAPAFSSLRRRTLRGHFTLPPLVNYVYPHFPDTDQCLLPHSPSPSSMEIQHTCYHLSVVLKIFRRLTLGVRKILHLRFLDLQGGIWTV